MASGASHWYTIDLFQHLLWNQTCVKNTAIPVPSANTKTTAYFLEGEYFQIFSFHCGCSNILSPYRIMCGKGVEISYCQKRHSYKWCSHTLGSTSGISASQNYCIFIGMRRNQQ